MLSSCRGPRTYNTFGVENVFGKRFALFPYIRESRLQSARAGAAALTPVRLTFPTCFSHLSASSCAAYAARCAGVRPELSAVNSVPYRKAGVVSVASSCSGTGCSTGRESAERGKASMTFPPSSTIAARHATCPACVQRKRGQYCHYTTPRGRVLCLM